MLWRGTSTKLTLTLRTSTDVGFQVDSLYNVSVILSWKTEDQVPVVCQDKIRSITGVKDSAQTPLTEFDRIQDPTIRRTWISIWTKPCRTTSLWLTLKLGADSTSAICFLPLSNSCLCWPGQSSGIWMEPSESQGSLSSNSAAFMPSSTSMATWSRSCWHLQ